MANRQRFGSWLGTGLLLGALGATGCEDGGGSGPRDGKGVQSSRTGLVRAQDCDDLLAKIQEDAIAKVKLAVEAAKARDLTQVRGGAGWGPTPWPGADPAAEGPTTGDGVGAPAPTTPGGGNAGGGVDNGGSGGNGDGDSAGEGPTGSSDTNNQVAGVDEADFIKVVDNGRAMYLLHGNTLRRLTTWPAEETALDAASLTIEGSPSEMFVTGDGKAVIFSNVWGYGSGDGKTYAGDVACREFGPCYYGYNSTKITIADVSGDQFKTLRELYYEGQYISSRRYAADESDVVRVVLQASKDFSALSQPQIQWYDFEGKPYPEEDLQLQLEQWAERTERDIRKKELSYWLPLVYELQGEDLTSVPPACDNYFVPEAGMSGYGLTHVLSVDATKPDAAIGGVTVLGGAQTVYSNREHLVLAQPDYRWMGGVDFGVLDGERTALHMFGIEAADTSYLASGWVSGHLPSFNAQFGIDVKGGVVRVATTGWVRENPDSTPDQEDFWRRIPQNHVFTLEAKEAALSVVGQSDHFGHEGETVQSARFVGDRAYVVTFRQTDPLVVLDLSDAKAPKILGEIEIPGFSQYMHPLDDTHLITLGQNASWGVQLQLFDVTDPMNLPQPKVLDFGEASSEGQYNHKAFTFYREKSLLAIPLYSYNSGSAFGSMLRIVHVDAEKGFTDRGAVDHSDLFTSANSGCVQCYEWGCEYSCSYSPEVRRGHFVSTDETTYVYSFSHAGVLVNDVADLATNLASVTLPAPVYDGESWYGPATGGSRGGSDVGVDPVPPNQAPTPTPVDAGVAVDGGAAVDAGVAMEG